MYVLYLYRGSDGSSRQLKLAAEGTSDDPGEIRGNISFDGQRESLVILSLSRGIGDCGRYQVFSFDSPGNLPKRVEYRTKACDHPLEKSTHFANPKHWPTAPEVPAQSD